MQVLNAKYWYMDDQFSIHENQSYFICISNGVMFLYLEAYFLFNATGISVILGGEIKAQTIPLGGGYLKMDVKLPSGFNFVVQSNNSIELVLNAENELSKSDPQTVLCNFTISSYH